MTGWMPRASPLATSLKRIGWVGEEKVGDRKMQAFFELHIEQGPILEAEGKDIGVVTHGQGLRWIECTVTGKESHTGSTPMHMRKNAGRGLALVTELVHEIAMKNQPNAVGAIGHVDVYPNSRNIIPGKVVFTIDFRTPNLEKLNAMVDEFEERAPACARGSEVWLDWEIVGQFDPPAFDEGCVGRPRRRRAAWVFPHGYRERGRSRRLLDQRRGANGHGHVPLRRRAFPQRGGRDHACLGQGGDGCAHARGGGDGGDCGVSKTPLEKVYLANGVARTPLGYSEDSSYDEIVNAVLDLVCCVRSETPNRALGLADRFIGAGEWGLAMEEISAVLEAEMPLKSEFIAAAFERADKLLPADSEGRRE